jgi:hypothetical protein
MVRQVTWLGLLRRAWIDVAVGALAVGAALFVGGRALGTGFPLDDAWIHMVYGLALRTDGSLAYNHGHAATGCTSPAWSTLIALADVIAGARGPSMHAVCAVQAIGVTLHAVQATLGARLARACAPQRTWGTPLALGAGALIACAPTLAFAAVSGMEVPLEGGLLVGALLAAMRQRWVMAGALAGAAALARPEGALGVIAVAWLAFVFGRLRAAATALGVGLIPIAALLARNIAVSGRPLPATFYVKANPTAMPLTQSLVRGLVDALGGMRPASHWLLWGGVAAALGVGAFASTRSLRSRGPAAIHERGAIMAGTVAALGLAYATGISALSFFENPHSFYYQRYVAPPLVLLIVAAVASFSWPAQSMRRVVRERFVVAATLVPTMVGVFDEALAWRDDRTRFAVDVASINAEQARIGRWIDSTLPAEAVVWTIDAGAVRYWGRRATVDLVRLNTPELFDGARVKKAWWPTAIVVIPEIFQVATAEAVLDLVLVAESPAAAPGLREAWREEVYMCLQSAVTARDNRVLVLYEKEQVIAIGRCVAPH